MADVTDANREALIEQVVSAHRARDPRGEPIASPAFYDLDAQGREQAFEQALLARTLEAALDPEGQSTTVHAVLARIRAARGGPTAPVAPGTDGGATQTTSEDGGDV